VLADSAHCLDDPSTRLKDRRFPDGLLPPPIVGNSDRLEKLLEHPAIWRGRSVAQVETVSTGFVALDCALPGQGWPRAGLIEVLVSRLGMGELYLLLPALAALTQQPSARWCAWISPPFEPFAPALAAHGVALDRVFVTRGDSPEWAFEQALISGACEVVLGWAGKRSAVVSRAGRNERSARACATKGLQPRDIRRLQLAAEKGRALGVLFRPRRAASESSSAVLRVTVESAERGARVALLKSRGGQRGSIDLTWNSPSARSHGST
jgi:cell division inhibitor SulA